MAQRGLDTLADLGDRHVICSMCDPCGRSTELKTHQLVAVYAAELRGSVGGHFTRSLSLAPRRICCTKLASFRAAVPSQAAGGGIRRAHALRTTTIAIGAGILCSFNGVGRSTTIGNSRGCDEHD